MLAAWAPSVAEAKILNVPYDVTREFYKEFNPAFAAYWKAQDRRKRVTINQSHGGSSKQARSVVDGLEADVITMNQAERHRPRWRNAAALSRRTGRKRLPNNSAPVHVDDGVSWCARAIHGKHHDWDDLAQARRAAVIPEPRDVRQRRATATSPHGAT